MTKARIYININRKICLGIAKKENHNKNLQVFFNTRRHVFSGKINADYKLIRNNLDVFLLENIPFGIVRIIF
jgi:hypothetical protein